MPVIFDKDKNLVLDYNDIDTTKGTFDIVPTNVYYVYVIDEEAIIEDKNDEQIIIKPEKGHWEIWDMNNQKLDWPIDLDTKDFPKDEKLEIDIPVYYYRDFTEEELEYKKQQEEIIKQQEILKTIPYRVDDLEDINTEIVLFLADIIGGAI